MTIQECETPDIVGQATQEIVAASPSSKGPKMSVVDRTLKEENEVSTMTNSTVSAPATASLDGANGQRSTDMLGSFRLTSGARVRRAGTIRSSADYTVSERLVANIALALLRWSNRRADRAQPTHERMALILENERVRAGHDPYRRTR